MRDGAAETPPGAVIHYKGTRCRQADAEPAELEVTVNTACASFRGRRSQPDLRERRRLATQTEIELHFLPSHLPELNPDELVNADLKRSLPMHSRAQNQAQLAAETRRFFHRRQPHIVRGHFGGLHVRYTLE